MNPGGNGAHPGAGDWDLDGTNIPGDSSEPVSSCDECGANIYAENDGNDLCDQCEFYREKGRP